MKNKNFSKIAQIITENKFFFIPYLIFLVISTAFIIYYGHKNSFIILNQINCPFLDAFFYISTNIGNGIFILIAVVILIFIRLRLSIYLILAYLTSGATVQIIKNTTKCPRPKAFFTNGEIIHYIQGVEIYQTNSFPSGHTASAFALFLTLTLATKNNFLKLVFFICALLVSYSRVYLAQHFPIDILVGSFLGIVFTLLVFIIIENKYKSNVLDHSLNYLITHAKRKK